MQFRWLLVCIIVVWVVYDCIKPHLLQYKWGTHTQMRLKLVAAILVCLVIWRLPTVDSFVVHNRDFVDKLLSTLRQNRYSKSEMQQKIESGVSLAGGNTHPSSHHT